MTTFEIELLRAELARRALNSNDEGLLKKALQLFGMNDKACERIPGLTYDQNERVNELREAMTEYKSGKSKGLTSDELDNEMKSW